MCPAQGSFIRRAESSDLSQLLHLLTRYFREGEVANIDSHATIARYLDASELGFFVAVIGQELIACVLIRPIAGIDHAAECKRLYVAPEARGNALAARLMDEAEASALAAGYQWMYLDSKDNFPVAIEMYRKRGYNDCARYNDNTEATVFLRKPLAT